MWALIVRNTSRVDLPVNCSRTGLSEELIKETINKMRIDLLQDV